MHIKKEKQKSKVIFNWIGYKLYKFKKKKNWKKKKKKNNPQHHTGDSCIVAKILRGLCQDLHSVSKTSYFTLVFTHKITLQLFLLLKLNAKDNYLNLSSLKKVIKIKIVKL